jgi:hypothetical protein
MIMYAITKQYFRCQISDARGALLKMLLSNVLIYSSADMCQLQFVIDVNVLQYSHFIFRMLNMSKGAICFQTKQMIRSGRSLNLQQLICLKKAIGSKMEYYTSCYETKIVSASHGPRELCVPDVSSIDMMRFDQCKNYGHPR